MMRVMEIPTPQEAAKILGRIQGLIDALDQPQSSAPLMASVAQRPPMGLVSDSLSTVQSWVDAGLLVSISGCVPEGVCLRVYQEGLPNRLSAMKPDLRSAVESIAGAVREWIAS